jgi:hypothetical protein
MKLSSAALAFILFTIPCLAQQNAATIELGRASIRIGMPQDKAISALAAEGFILKKMGTQYIVGRIGRTGQTSPEGMVSFASGVVSEAHRDWSPKDDTEGEFVRTLYVLIQKLEREGRTLCKLNTSSATVDAEKDWKQISLQCGEKSIHVDLTEYHDKDARVGVSIKESLNRNSGYFQK